MVIDSPNPGGWQDQFQKFRDFLGWGSDTLDAPGQVVRGALGYRLPDLPTPDPSSGPGPVQSALHMLAYGGTAEDARADWQASALAQQRKMAETRAMRDAGASGQDIWNFLLSDRPAWARATAHLATNPLNYALGVGRGGLAVAQAVDLPSGVVNALRAASVAGHVGQAAGQVIGRVKAFTPPPDVARTLLHIASGDTSSHPDDPDVIARAQFDEFVRFLQDRASGSYVAPGTNTEGR